MPRKKMRMLNSKEDFDAVLRQRAPGFVKLYWLISDFDAGKRLPRDELAFVIDALRELLGKGSTPTLLNRFAKRAGLISKGGRREPTANEAERREILVFEVFLRERELVSAGMQPNKARTDAVREVAANRHCAVRTLQENIIKFGESARSVLSTHDYLVRQRAKKRTAGKL